MNELLQSNSYIYNQVYWVLQIVISEKIHKFFVFLRREVLRPQYFHNIFTINHRWLVVIDSNLNITLKLYFCSNNNN